MCVFEVLWGLLRLDAYLVCVRYINHTRGALDNDTVAVKPAKPAEVFKMHSYGVGTGQAGNGGRTSCVVDAHVILPESNKQVVPQKHLEH